MPVGAADTDDVSPATNASTAAPVATSEANAASVVAPELLRAERRRFEPANDDDPEAAAATVAAVLVAEAEAADDVMMRRMTESHCAMALSASLSATVDVVAVASDCFVVGACCASTIPLLLPLLACAWLDDEEELLESFVGTRLPKAAASAEHKKCVDK